MNFRRSSSGDVLQPRTSLYSGRTRLPLWWIGLQESLMPWRTSLLVDELRANGQVSVVSQLYWCMQYNQLLSNIGS